jgi:hydroxyacylglutathione hydrolase
VFASPPGELTAARSHSRIMPPVFFRQVLYEDLGCASYVIADGGEAAIIDPKWEIDDYLALASEQGFRIAHVLETHNHADHVSGHGRLVAATGARIHVSAEAGAAYAHEPLRDGSTVELGNVRVTALGTPGHRPEHLAYVVRDGGRSDAACAVITGDSLFVGDLARPDLAVEPEEGARGLFGSLRRLLELEDFAEVWPAHVGGSLCGGAGMSAKPGSTIGFERRYNRFAQIGDVNEFVRTLTGKTAPQPPNFERIVELNRGPFVNAAVLLEPLTAIRVKESLDNGAILVDGRDPRAFDSGHVPGSINVTMAKPGVGTRAAWAVGADVEILAAAETDDEARRLGRMLEAVALRRLRGYLAGGLTAWRQAGLDVETTVALDAAALGERLRCGDLILIDVREADEWEEGHVRDSINVPYHDLPNGLPDDILVDGRPVAVACSAGNRSSTAASLLKRAGVRNVIHVADGGVADVVASGVELEGSGT